eukprot:CAMPEP_0203663894 /NCGR_PEP_ID=MMETSP0090-20130426/1393_1 /ASSEMBLY_ACC=CAM_ASM_001088 /TAXON_ID=426623 /ORGANISM="Chaetoceros affinis, Strain CCMP159" /LENGTH=772 /DNA_ID=CAMNT_0050526939 /DNA_START=221 /DNA_END=2539 /DNA_ORIENTATION=+
MANLFSGIFIFIASSAIIAAEPEAPSSSTSTSFSWDDLKSSLSNDATFQVSNVDDWFDQCIAPFADLNLPIPFGPCDKSISDSDCDDPVSNYQLYPQPSGLCMAAANCGYKKCEGGPFGKQTSSAGPAIFNSTQFPKEQWTEDDTNLDLPDVVVHPIHVGDLSAAVKFASEHKIGVSVKTSGHSYTGSSTKKGTLLLNLSKLQKYSPFGSIVECQVDPNIEEKGGAFQDACNYAIGRNKPAVLRVGGGELWDEALRAVFIDWNENANENNSQKYHVVSGAAGTVSAAGGWLASGGLSGTNGMRMFGLGIDQVLHIEMVLPSGKHVRFGPTEWEKQPGKMYAVTTKVTGYCNEGDLSDEDLWDWQECEDIDFAGLWYAVRGGGGGTYGVITSIYYQLHHFTKYESVVCLPTENFTSQSAEELEELGKKWIEFFLRFLYLPESIGVTEFASNSCGSPNGGFNPATGPSFVCNNNAGGILKGAWERFYSTDAVDISIDGSWPSYAHHSVFFGGTSSNIPEGRAYDGPQPGIYSSFDTFFDASTQDVVADEYMVFPTDTIVNKLDLMIEMFYECVFIHETCAPGGMYLLGGNIASADDGMNALSTSRRHSAFKFAVYSLEWRTKFKQIFYGVESGKPFAGKSFPGELCHNHVSPNFPTALKDDWTQGCDPRWSEEMRKEKCLSFHEAAWGTEGLMKLQGIHAAVDPDNLFNCWDCVGNAPDLKKEKKDKKKKDKKKKKMMKKYPNCNPDDWTMVGDGYCDSVYNNTECGFDGGDCL